MTLGLLHAQQHSAAGSGPANRCVGTGLPQLSPAFRRVNLPLAQSLCGVAGGNGPHKHTAVLEGRREPAGCCCSGSVLLPGATLLTASSASSLSGRLWYVSIYLSVVCVHLSDHTSGESLQRPLGADAGRVVTWSTGCRRSGGRRGRVADTLH